MPARVIRNAFLFAALGFSAALLAAEPMKLPEFLSKVQLHNFDGIEPTPDGQGVILTRLPKEVRAALNVKAQLQFRKPAGSEIRFVLNAGEKLQNVKLLVEVLPEPGHLGADQEVTVECYAGDWASWLKGVTLRSGKVNAVMVTGDHGSFASRVQALPHGAYPNTLWRLVFHGAPIILRGIEGNVRPPKPEDVPPMMITYGTSITHGARASHPGMTWPALTARNLRLDPVNLGSSGSAFCEKEIADYIATRPFALCVLELSVNMVNDFSVEEFRTRATYFVNTIAAARPQAPVVCISLFPHTRDFAANGKPDPKAQAFRDTLEAICNNSPHNNVHFIKGPELLSPHNLTQDVLHPSDYGMIEISQQLTARLTEIMKK